MKIDKAIELDQETERSLRDHKFPDHADAIMLGHEALLRILAGRNNPDTDWNDPLPDETKD